jgi:hypothetical protein
MLGPVGVLLYLVVRAYAGQLRPSMHWAEAGAYPATAFYIY